MTSTPIRDAALPRVGSRALAALAGALGVALLAQVAIPLPGTPVPMTLAPLGVVLVGGLLGPRTGAAALALYLVLGVIGLPVYAPFGAPGAARLLGPTGGYLLAYPAAAAVCGLVAAREPGLVRSIIAALAGLAVVHAGGVAQLLLLTGGPGPALALGTLPFVAGDLAKAAVAALVIRRFRPRAATLR